MRFAVYGSGGVGGYFGARLAQAGEQVHFIARGAHLQAMQSHGLRLQSIHGDYLLETPQATDDASAIGVVDVVLLCVKSWQVTEAAQAMAPLIAPETVVLTLLNGVESADQVAAVIGAEHLLGGVAKIFSHIGEPGVICHIGHQPTIVLGELDGTRSERVSRLAAVLEGAGICVEQPAQIRLEQWRKFLFITGWGGLSAISRAPIGILRSQPETRQLIGLCLQETLAVANAEKIPFDADILDQTWAFIDSLEPSGTTSLQRDIAAGRPSEIDAWDGAVVRIGRRHGVATPHHDLITTALLPLERRARGEISF